MFDVLNRFAALDRLAPALTQGVPFRVALDGLIYERVTDDLTGEYLYDDVSGAPLYAEVIQ